MSTITLEKRKSVIRFYDPLFDHDNDKYTDVTITVERKRYANKKEFFYIDYKYKYSQIHNLVLQAIYEICKKNNHIYIYILKHQFFSYIDYTYLTKIKF